MGHAAGEDFPQWGGEVGLLVEECEASEMQLEMAPASPVVVSIPEEGGALELQLEEAPCYCTAPPAQSTSCHQHPPEGPEGQVSWPAANTAQTHPHKNQCWAHRVGAASVGK